MKNKKLKMKNYGVPQGGTTIINKMKSGFSILEVVASIFIFAVVTLVIYGSFNAGLKSLAESKHRIAATELANEKMEIIRNLPYISIGTVGGVPSGTLPQDETVTRSNQKFNVHTFIRYVDDAKDGIGDDDENMVTTDYKEVKVEVTWASVKAGHGVKSVSKFVPNGAETDVGGGTFRLNVMDGSGTGLPGASVHIVNDQANPPVNINTNTDSYGSVLLSGMPAGDRDYEISVSKDDYESVTTLPPYPTTAYNPTDEHASVIEDQLNTKAIIIDKLSNLHIYFVDIQGQPLLNADFNLKGGRVIGTVPVTNEEVTNYDQNLSSGETGDINVSDIPAGKYDIALDQPGYTLIGSDINLPIALAPDQSIDANLIFASNSTNSAVVTVKNSVTKLPISYATVHLYNGTDFDVTQVTGDMGQVYFPPNTDPPTALNAGAYTLDVSAAQYDSYSGNIDINALTQQEVQLTPIPAP